MSSQPFTIRIRIGGNEVELSGSREDVLKSLEELPKIVNQVSGAFTASTTSATIIPMPQQAKAEPPATSEEFPTISVSLDTPCPDVIIRLLATDWGRKTPRVKEELMEAMHVNAIHYPEGTVKGRLTDLTKKGTLRRIKTERGYGYILTKLPE